MKRQQQYSSTPNKKEKIDKKVKVDTKLQQNCEESKFTSKFEHESNSDSDDPELKQYYLNEKLFDAVMDNKPQKAKKLIKQGANLNAKDGLHENLLHLSAREGSIDCMEWLVKKCGFDINKLNHYLGSPAHVAAYAGNLVSVKWLRDQGADICSYNKDFNTPKELYIKGDYSGKSEKEWDDYFGKESDDVDLNKKREKEWDNYFGKESDHSSSEE